MIIFWLLLVPVLIGIGGLILGKGRVTLKELAVHETVVAAVIGMGYLIAVWGRTADTEIWNGVIAKKGRDTEGCCHSYPCNPHPCGKDNKDTCWDTCYLHSYDINWNARTSNGESAYRNGCNEPGSSPPARWRQIVEREPTAIEHGYTNYIKGNPDTILRRRGIKDRFAALIPKYPIVYDHYRANRFLIMGLHLPDAAALNAKLSEINGRLGATKQVNIIVIVVKGDQMYLEGLREAWLGGKKNDLVVAVGVPNFPEIAWAGVMSWTRNEEIKVAIRDRVMDMKTFDGDKLLGIVAEEVQSKFVRRPMADFEYLRATIEPPGWASWLLFAFGCVLSVGLQIYFWIEDPFGDRRRY